MTALLHGEDAVPFSGPWLAGNERMKKKMEATVMGFVMGCFPKLGLPFEGSPK